MPSWKKNTSDKHKCILHLDFAFGLDELSNLKYAWRLQDSNWKVRIRTSDRTGIQKTCGNSNKGQESFVKSVPELSNKI